MTAYHRAIQGTRIASAPPSLWPQRYYVYRGTKTGQDDPIVPWRPGDPIMHGSTRGASQHRRMDEPLCAECREALNAGKRKYRRGAR